MINLKLKKFQHDIKGKRVAVIGIGISNIPAIEYLAKLGARVTALDKKEALGEECKKLQYLGVEFILGEHYLSKLSNYDYILRSPGIKPFLPEIEEAVAKGVKLISEVELVAALAPCKVIGVTGSDGKTTTTTLIAKFLEKAGYHVWLGGNIGTPLFTKLDEMQDTDIVVLELSSFQLMTLKERINIAVVTNISPNHLDYHRSYGEYILAKANIFLHQQKEDIVVFNQDDKQTKDYIDLLENNHVRTHIREFSMVEDVKKGVYLQEDNIVSNVAGEEEFVAKIVDVKLVGIHNLANICAAASAVIDMTGIEPIREVITTFQGVEHRMEFVREVDGVKWYNDSIGTSPTRTIAGLVSFRQKIILIAGGYDKNIPYDEMGEYILNKVKALILMGKTAPKIEEAVRQEAERQDLVLEEVMDVIHCNNLEECVKQASKLAKEGDSVVLSPASASFDLYKNFEERGNHFKALVEAL